MIYDEILKTFFDYVCRKSCLEKEIPDLIKLHS